MATSKFDSFGTLVDTKNGFISREIYVDQDIYKEELERVFTRAWLFIGHESLIPNNGDFALLTATSLRTS
jgi:phenylpropionate dioxygenase-like ring-hydroxylating dioxygenase large terminal subunit